MAVNTQTASTPQYGGVKTAMTALAGGAAPTLAANTLEAFNTVSTVATTLDSVILPAGMPLGAQVVVWNQHASNSIKVFPNTGATVNGGTASTQYVALAATIGMICIQTGTDGLTWMCVKGAVAVPA